LFTFSSKEAYFYTDWLPVTPRCASRGNITRVTPQLASLIHEIEQWLTHTVETTP